MQHRRPLDARERAVARRNYIILSVCAFLFMAAVLAGTVVVLD